MLRGSQNGKRCSKGTELLKGAEAALPCETHGKFDKCNIQAVSGRTGHALWQIAPSSSFLAHLLPSLPLQPHPGREHLGPPPRRPSDGGDSVSNLRSKLETSRRKWEPPLSLIGQQGPLGLFSGLFVKTLVSGFPSTRSLVLGHVSRTLGTATGWWGRVWSGRMWHLSCLPLLGAASFPILLPLSKPRPHLPGLHLALRITTCDPVMLTFSSLPT